MRTTWTDKNRAELGLEGQAQAGDRDRTDRSLPPGRDFLWPRLGSLGPPRHSAISILGIILIEDHRSFQRT